MRKSILLLIMMIIPSCLFAQMSEQTIRAEYEGYIKSLEQSIRGAQKEVDEAIRLHDLGYYSDERYYELRQVWEEEIEKARRQIAYFRNQMEAKLDQFRRIEQQRLEAAQQKAQRERAEQAKRAKAQQEQRTRAERERQAQRAKELEEQRRAERERRRQEEERKRQEQYTRNYNLSIRQTSARYARRRNETDWLASNDALHEMSENMAYTRLTKSIEDVVVQQQNAQVTDGSGINRLKQRLNKTESLDQEMDAFDAASRFTLAFINRNAREDRRSDPWPFNSRIPITSRNPSPLYQYDESVDIIGRDGFGGKDEFVKSLSKMKTEELHYMEQVYGEYCELVEMADYSYHERPLSDELREKGWVDVSSENALVSKVCTDAEMESITETSGLKLSVLREGDRYVIAFGGTDFPNKLDITDIGGNKEFLKDAQTDVKGLFTSEEQQVRRAKEAVRRLVEECGIPLDKIEFTGHSLGGRIAAEMSVAYARPATTFNAAGVSEETRKQYESLLMNSKSGYTGIRNISTEHDILTDGQRIISGSANPYVAALPKESIRIANETVSGTLSSDTGKGAMQVLDLTGPIGMGVKEVIEGTGKTLSIADKANTYYNRDYRALGAPVVIPDEVGAMDAHRLETLKSGLYSRYNSVIDTIGTSSDR